MTEGGRALERFYDLLDELRTRVGGPRRLGECSARSGWPQRGVYFFFEEGERRRKGDALRVVRVGTHGIAGASRTTLWGRLAQHRGVVGGSRAGGGNHRGSIFRLHVGTALLNRDERFAKLRATWGRGGSAPREVRLAEDPLEQAGSAVIRQMPLLWVGVIDDVGKASARAVIEAGAIGLLSGPGRATDPPSGSWLGQYAACQDIRASGLWNTRHVGEQYDPAFLDVLEEHICRMPAG